MREIFVSYTHADNHLNPQITHEVTDAIDHFLDVYRYVCDIPGDKSSELFFLDRTSIRDGDLISETVRQAIEDCTVMLAFYSPKYFRSYYCLEEYKEFKRLQNAELEDAKHAEGGGGVGRVPKLLIPIEVKPVNPEKIELIDEELSPKWIAELTTSEGLQHSVTSEILLSRDTARLAHALRGMDAVIQDRILSSRGSSGERRAASNILTFQAKIEYDSLRSVAIADELRTRSQHLKYNKLSPVCVLYAGGTVGMVNPDASDVQHADYEMAEGVDVIARYLRPRLSALPFNMHFFSLNDTIDSSNVTAQDWVNLANLVREQMQNYQGFVILHGTNTLAYSASALSFLLSDIITKPVVFTGAEVPLSIHNTDAIHNIENAIRAVAWQAYNGPMRVPEVCVYWNNHLYRGNRTTKKYASDRTDSFHTPNMPVPLGTLANERLNVEHSQIQIRPDSASMVTLPGRGVVNIATGKVAVMFIHPQMDLSDLEVKYPNDLDGLLLLSYGPGNVPEDPLFISAIKRLIANGVVIGNVTQCPYGRVELKLFETSAIIFDLGVVDAYDMTIEAAYTKLLWAIGRWGNGKQPGVLDSIRRTFRRNVAGEMSATIYDVGFGSSDTFYKSEDTGYLISDVRRFDSIINRYDISEVFIRLEGVKLPGELQAALIRINFGHPTDKLGYATDENCLAEFNKVLSNDEIEAGYFDKNLEITHPFRKWFGNEEFQLSIGMEEMSGLMFSSLRLVMYCKFARSG